MKRLIRKAEIYDAFDGHGNYYECYKNPTSKEWGIIKDQNHYDKNKIRVILLRNGTVYAWSSDIVHEEAISRFNIPDGIHLNVDPDDIGMYLIPETNIEYLKEAFSNTTSLYNYASKNSSVGFINLSLYGGIYYEEYDSFKKINDIINVDIQEEAI